MLTTKTFFFSDPLFSPSLPTLSLLLLLLPCSGGLSKLFAAGGYRFGCALIPGEGFEKGLREGRKQGEGFGKVWEGLRVVISETYSCVSAPIQWAAVKVFFFLALFVSQLLIFFVGWQSSSPGIRRL